jgi:hypothetical protein
MTAAAAAACCAEEVYGMEAGPATTDGVVDRDDVMVGRGTEDDMGMVEPERGAEKEAYSNRGTHTSTQL